MIKIWQVIGLKENQNLTVKEQQDKITNILSDMKKDAETSAKRALKKEFIKTVSISLNAL